MKRLPTAAPYTPAQFTIEPVELAALKAFQRGEATEEQQRVAWIYITERLCDTYGLSYRPNQRDTDFAEGKRFVGLEMVKLSKLDAAYLRKRNERSSTGKPRDTRGQSGDDNREQPG